MLNLVWVDRLDNVQTETVRELLLAAREVDGRPEVQATGPFPPEFSGGSHVLGYLDTQLVGYTHVDRTGDAFGRRVAELLVHPQYRRQGYGTAVLREVVDKVPQNLRVWAHGDHPAAARLAEQFHLHRARELLVMAVSSAGAEWPEPEPGPGYRLRTFVPAQDEQAMVAANAKAFDWHPEQGALTVEQLRATEVESWFDPAGFFLAENERGEVVGFHQTKVHPPNPERFGGEPVGEVYVVGVDPDTQGSGLGRALTLAGLRYLRDRGLGQVILYVEGDNAPAVAVYRRLGFESVEVDVQYALEV